MFKAFFNWLKTTGKGSATKQKELDEANAAPYKVEAPSVQEEKLEKLSLQNGDLDAPLELVARAAKLDAPESTEVKPAAMKAKKASKPKADGAVKPKATKPRTPKKPNMTVAK